MFFLNDISELSVVHGGYRPTDTSKQHFVNIFIKFHEHHLIALQQNTF